MDVYAGLRERLERGETINLDGGIGAELVRRGVRWRDHGLRFDASAVQQLHEEYLAAGADLIRAHTFQLNHRIYLNVFRNWKHMHHIGGPGLESRTAELLGRAVDIARTARARSGRRAVAVAGVMAPLEHCFRPYLAPPDEAARAEHRTSCLPTSIRRNATQRSRAPGTTLVRGSSGAVVVRHPTTSLRSRRK